MVRSSLIAVATLAFANTAQATTLWQNAETGMTRVQVKTAFPNVTPPAKVSALYDGVRCELAIHDYDVSSYKYEVCFYFLNGKLTQVTLTGAKPTQPQFEDLVSLLRVKYGPEIQTGQPLCKAGSMTMCNADWAVKSGANINVVFITFGPADDQAVLNINYQTRIAKGASKL